MAVAVHISSRKAAKQCTWNSIHVLEATTMTEVMWRCDQVRAGQLYNRMMFDTRAEAESFAQRMQQVEPDQVFSIEAIEARQVWN
jgi:hypothetical protein